MVFFWSVDLRCLDMEKNKEDATSPRGVLDACARDSRSNKFSRENSKLKCSISRGLFYWSKLFKLWNKRSIKSLASFPPVNITKAPKRKSRSVRENPLFCTLYDFKSSLVNFTFSELQLATNNFSDGMLLAPEIYVDYLKHCLCLKAYTKCTIILIVMWIVVEQFVEENVDICIQWFDLLILICVSLENLIGRGGYADVYKGCLKDGQLIAVKRMTKGTADEKTSGFLSELGIIAHVNHPNTAKLIGSCIEEGMHLVFELSPLGSLGSFLHGLCIKILFLLFKWYFSRRILFYEVKFEMSC